ncbi:MAG: carbamoyltransferase HypF [Thermoleophilaceae bacterium]|nr:carbamoyltransferase HypF [Thermoleophilaceae bacterium]
MSATRARASVQVQGVVQGVGFRPYVHRLAAELGLDGFVLNDEHGVVIEVEGDTEAVERFLERLPLEAPPLARLERVVAGSVPATGEAGFEIRVTRGGGEPDARVAPDAATCADCLAELLDPADRRFRYPFVNCTNCGPRFTIVRGVPYDRPNTTMAAFEMCAACSAEYHDPANRRFHAQPNACPECGPRAALVFAGGDPAAEPGADPVTAAARALLAGAIVAVKGLGGFHLACRADHERAVAELRARKHREDKPFALMAPDLAAARELAVLSDAGERLLLDSARPIVLAPRRAGAPVAGAVAPRSAELGVMLPYSPLHHLLLADTGAVLVMTSGNVSDEPIAYDDEDARERLTEIADLFLVHDREIETRTDDSVVRVAHGRTQLLRRSRGHVPAALELPVDCGRHLLATGAELKNTFALAKGRDAWVGHHVGDLRNYETLRSFTDGIDHFRRLFAVEPEAVAHDLHPEYLSTKHALELEGVETVGVQHHHAHMAACLAEHGRTGPAVGAIFDGTGFGADGTVWGGELLFGDLRGFERAGLLHPVRMPGGEAAIREPWRMACAWLGQAPPLPRVDPGSWAKVSELVRTGVASPLTSSAGRLFDAVAAICGVRTTVSYEGQAAVELEAAADPAEGGAYPLPVVDHGGEPLVLDARSTVAAVAAAVDEGTETALVAARFHNAVAAATARACALVAERRAVETVVLSGGVFQNRLLLSRTAALLEAAGLEVLLPERLPPNDGGISYGQLAVAAARLG